ncbi:hypothetical protein H4582DRAFT_492432 [Lactarius indigo]|nr:hypothetical protein H4582DRAFT_492432 [Lactarius indigo]
MSDLWLSPESGEADQHCFAPSPESFEEFLEELDNNIDVDVQSLTSPDDPFHNFRGFTPPPGPASPSESTLTTQSSDGPAISECSFMTNSTPSYPALPFDNFVSQFNAVDPKHGMFSDLSALLDLDSFGHQLSPAFFTDVYVVNQSDDGPYRPPVGISPHILSDAFQGPPPPYSVDPPVCAGPATQSGAGPVREKYVCPHCGHRSARRHNLKTHMETHNPNRDRPFVCPISDCRQPFTRKHDLKRHLESMHGGRAK